jgi:hypothetical protein
LGSLAEDAGRPPEDGQKIEATICLLLACECIQKREMREADKYLTLAARAWPNSPLLVFVTGERLAADGQYEQAADSLEKSASTAAQQQFAELLRDRARKMRDSRGAPDSLLGDIGFVAFAARLALSAAAVDSEKAAQAERRIGVVQNIANEIESRLPGMER